MWRESPWQVDIERWTRIRSRGKKRFVLTRGVLGWGITTWAFFSILDGVAQHPLHSLAVPVVSLLVFMGVGWFWGSRMWFSMERKHSTRA